MTESEIIEYLNFSKDRLSKKAEKLGYKRTTVNVDGSRRSGWVKGETLFTSLKSLVKSHKKFPLGFDYYYWGYQIRKDKYE